MQTFTRILAPTDFSAQAAESTRVATEFARRYAATLTVVHVYEPIAMTAPGGFVFLPPPQLDELFAYYERELAAIRQSAIAAGATQVDTRLLQGFIASEIVDFANEHGVDLIVMGTHGRTGLKRFLLGSVAERVVRAATCPVLSVRPRATTDATPTAQPARREAR